MQVSWGGAGSGVQQSPATRQGGEVPHSAQVCWFLREFRVVNETPQISARSHRDCSVVHKDALASPVLVQVRIGPRRRGDGAEEG